MAVFMDSLRFGFCPDFSLSNAEIAAWFIVEPAASRAHYFRESYIDQRQVPTIDAAHMIARPEF